jgi:branched-chain amino acid transport system ATP-binding protein
VASVFWLANFEELKKMSNSLLEVDSVSKHFGGLTALSNVNLTVEEGSITSLIGPNGAGKTTLFNAITNLSPADTGEVYFQGERIDNLDTHMVAVKGIQRTFQLLQVFKELSVLENTALGMHVKGNSGFLNTVFRMRKMRSEEEEIFERSLAAIKFVGLEAKSSMTAGQLPYGQQKMVEFARAIVSEPKLLLLDEPTNGLNPSERGKLTELIREIRERHTSILLVAHDMGTVMGISDKIYVLNFGEKIAEGTPMEIAQNQKVIKVYLGEEYSIA